MNLVPGIRALRQAVVPPAGAGLVASSALADAVGSGLFLSGSVIYFSQRLGLSPMTIGTGLGIAGVVALLVVAPLGAVGDRTGYAHALRTAHLLRAALFPLYLLVDGPVSFALVVTALTVCDRFAAPMFHAVVGTTVGDERRTETMGYVRALRNAGFSVGALLTGAAVAVGTPAAYDALVVGNAVSFLVAFALLARVRNVRSQRADDAGPRLRGIRPRYAGLAALNIVLLFHDMILLVALPLYVIEQTDVPPAVLPLLFALNTVLVVALQRWLSLRAATMDGAARATQAAGLYLAGACGCLAVVGLVPPVLGVVALVAGVVLLTVGESLQVAGAWELSYRHAPASDRGAHLALFSLGLGLQRSLAPVVLSVFVTVGALAWIPLAGAFVAAGTAVRHTAGRPWPPRGEPTREGRARPLHSAPLDHAQE